MRNTYYFPIKSVNLPHYFSKACICPTKYIQNRNSDIQNDFENYLLFSNAKFTTETNCCLEIVLNQPKEQATQVSGRFFLYNKPLPISRVKRIIFQDEIQKKTSVFNIISGTAFLPLELVEIDETSSPINVNEVQNISYKVSEIDWTNTLEKFDKILGGFALMRIAGKDFQNYSDNYFHTLSSINSRILKEINAQSIKETKPFAWVIKDNNEYPEIRQYIYEKINDDVIESFAKKEEVLLHKRNGKYPLEEIRPKRTTYLMAILGSYGNGNRLKLDTFISDFISGKLNGRREGVALIFGINKGYEAFRNNYKTHNFEVDIKFKLESQLDYYTIESVFQYVFNLKENSGVFPYIDDWCPKNKESLSINSFETYKILDKIIIYKKKEERDVGSFYSKLFQDTFNYREKIYVNLIQERHKSIPSYIPLPSGNEEGIKYFANLLEPDFENYTQEIYEKTNAEARLNSEKQNQIFKNKVNTLNKEIDDLRKENRLLRESKEILQPQLLEEAPATNDKGISTIPFPEQDPFVPRKEKRRSELKSMKLLELRKIGKERKIKGSSKCRKNVLVDKIINSEFSYK